MTCSPIRWSGPGRCTWSADRHQRQHQQHLVPEQPTGLALRTGALGITTTSFIGRRGACSGGGRRPYNGCYIVDADIQFNEVSYPSNRGRWGTADRGRHIDVESIAVHEIGHALGLDHPCENCTVDAVMTPSYVGYPFRYLRQDDTDGICGVYPGQRGGLGLCAATATATQGSASRIATASIAARPAATVRRVTSAGKAVVRTSVCVDALADAAGRGEALCRAPVPGGSPVPW